MSIVLEVGSGEAGLSGEPDVVEAERFVKSRSGKVDIAEELRAGEIDEVFELHSAEVCSSMEQRIPERHFALEPTMSEIGIVKDPAVKVRKWWIGGRFAHGFSMLPNLRALIY
jgi:hypothetical protein